MGLKNAGEIIDDVLDDVQFSGSFPPQTTLVSHFNLTLCIGAVNEQCTAWSECTTFAKFIDAGKPVFQIEYPSEDDLDKSTICGTSGAAKGSDKFSKVIKSMDLDGSVEYCGGSKTYRTTLGSS